jgi:nitroimidazol reductase NimA-like FMN-containing flavoprotein (pyridoxamine 5'-phosphate oxidase superfamily)
MKKKKKSNPTPRFEFIEKELRRKTFGILSTIDQNGKSHSTGIIYAISPPQSKFSLYILTEKNYKKVRNVQFNSSVSFVVPFPHYILRFVPSSCIQFQGKAEILPFRDSEAQQAFELGSKMLKMNLKQAIETDPTGDQIVFIKITPNQKIFCYGLGLSLMQLRKNVEIGSYSVIIPNKRFYKP